MTSTLVTVPAILFAALPNILFPSQADATNRRPDVDEITDPVNQTDSRSRDDGIRALRSSVSC
jgi:hypothetical protein